MLLVGARITRKNALLQRARHADLGYKRLSGRLEVSEKMKWAGTLTRESESLGAS